MNHFQKLDRIEKKKKKKKETEKQRNRYSDEQTFDWPEQKDKRTKQVNEMKSDIDWQNKKKVADKEL